MISIASVRPLEEDFNIIWAGGKRLLTGSFATSRAVSGEEGRGP